MISLLGALVVLTPDPVLVEALASLQQPTSVVATLKQVKTMKAFKRPQRATGRLMVVPPRQVRWEYHTPYKAELVINGDSMSMNYPDLGRKQRFDLASDPAMKGVVDTILFFMEAKPERVMARFEITARKLESNGLSFAELTLVPKSQTTRGFVASIRTTVDLKRGVLTSITLMEPDGDTTAITLTDIQINTAVNPVLLRP
jgi:outer membrane lipoprotein-sorting protein